MRNTALWAHWTGPFLSEALASVLGACAFSVTAPAVWNSLPSHIRLTVLTVSVTWKPTSTIVHSYPTATCTRLCIRGLHGAHAAIIRPFISHCWSASCIYISQIRLAEDLALATGHTYIFRQAANFEVRCRAIVNVDKHTQTHTEERERERVRERSVSFKFLFGIVLFSGLCSEFSVPHVSERLHLCVTVSHFLHTQLRTIIS